MNEMQTNTRTQTFWFGETPIRGLFIDGDAWLVGKDVAQGLGYTNPMKAIRDHVEEEDKGVNKSFTPGGMQEMVIINEPGLYQLTFRSKLPSAKQFTRWVTHEVLPQIRKTGAYGVPSIDMAGIENRIQHIVSKAIATELGKTESHRAETARLKATSVLLRSETDALAKLEQLQRDGLISKEDFAPIVFEFLRRARSMQPLARMHGANIKDDAAILAFVSHGAEITGGRENLTFANELYAAYADFCLPNEPCTPTRFNHRMATLFPDIEYNTKTIDGFVRAVYYGIRIKEKGSTQ